MRCLFGQREPADQLLCRDPESQAPWVGAGLPGPSRSQSRAGINAGPHVHFSLSCRVRASGDGNPPASSCLVQGTATGLWGQRPWQTLGPRAGSHRAAATGVESSQCLLWGLALVAPLSPWHERCPHASHGLQGSFLTWQPHLWPLEIQGLNCCSLDFPGFPEPLCFSTCLSLCL